MRYQPLPFNSWFNIPVQKNYRLTLLIRIGVLLVVFNSFSLETQRFVQRILLGQVQPLTPAQQSQQAEQLFSQVWQTVFLNYYKADFNHQQWQYWANKYKGKLHTTADATVAIQTMLSSLNDPYSIFLPPARYESQSLSIASKLFGIGLQIEGNNAGKIWVIATVPNAPAEKAGLQVGDEIIAIDQHATQGLGVEQSAKKIRGEKGTTVALTIVRKTKHRQQTLHFSVVRDEIKFKTVDTFTFKQYPAVGYIRLNSFISENLLEEVKQALTQFQHKTGLIIDVRGNLGGLLENAVALSDLFLDEGTIVSIKSRRPQYQYVATAHNGQAFTGKVVILTDKNSASASEVFAAALKDHGRAKLVGTQTFGKGLVQQVIPLVAEGQLQAESVGLNLTIAQYLTPNGNNIHGVGIVPTVRVAPFSNQALLKALQQDEKNIGTINTQLAGHLQQLLATGKREEAWLWADAPLQKACTLLTDSN